MQLYDFQRYYSALPFLGTSTSSSATVETVEGDRISSEKNSDTNSGERAKSQGRCIHGKKMRKSDKNTTDVATDASSETTKLRKAKSKQSREGEIEIDSKLTQSGVDLKEVIVLSPRSMAHGAFSTVYEATIDGLPCVCKVPTKHEEFIWKEFNIYRKLYPMPLNGSTSDLTHNAIDAVRNVWEHLTNEAAIYAPPVLVMKHNIEVPGPYESRIVPSCLFLPRYGTNLGAMRKTKSGGKFSPLCLVSIAIDLLVQIQNFHSKGFLHRDIKPDNFVCGFTSQGKPCVYLIDFGLATLLAEDPTITKCIPRRLSKKNGDPINVPGTLKFAGLHVMYCNHACRTDDLQGIAYSLACLAGKRLPWSTKSISHLTSEPERIRRVAQMKAEHLEMESLPVELAWFYKEVMQLGHNQIPPYEKYLAEFNAILKSNKTEKVYDWSDGRQKD